MAPRGWTTPEERTFLQLLKPQFLEAQQKKTGTSWHQEVDRLFFKKFPPTVSDKELGDLNGLDGIEKEERWQNIKGSKIARVRKVGKSKFI